MNHLLGGTASWLSRRTCVVHLAQIKGMHVTERILKLWDRDLPFLVWYELVDNSMLTRRFPCQETANAEVRLVRRKQYLAGIAKEQNKIKKS